MNKADESSSNWQEKLIGYQQYIEKHGQEHAGDSKLEAGQHKLAGTQSMPMETDLPAVPVVETGDSI